MIANPLHTDKPMHNYYQQLRRLTQPSTSSGYRFLIGFGMLGEGLIRFVDGALFPTPTMDYMPARFWGLIEAIFGLSLLLTLRPDRRCSKAGRIIASLACGYLVAMAATLYETSAPSAFVHVGAALVLAVEAQSHDECQ